MILHENMSMKKVSLLENFVSNKLFVCWDGEHLINKDMIPQQLIPVIDLFIEDNDGKPLECIKIHMGRLFLHGNNEQELMLRLNGPTFTVARIAFAHKRQGYMTRLETILLDICETCPDKKGIRIESVETEEMLQYCLKNNYKQHPSCIYDYIKEK